MSSFGEPHFRVRPAAQIAVVGLWQGSDLGAS
jgi:hypothetical protein